MEVLSIENIVREFQYQYMKNIVDTGHSASGKLALDQTYLLDFDGRYFTVSLNLQDYWKYLEEGTKPHWPPVSKILEWVRIKPVLPRKPLKNGKLPTQNQLAFMISRKISRVGTPATHLLQNSLSEFNLVGKVYDEFVRLWTDEETRKLITEE